MSAISNITYVMLFDSVNGAGLENASPVPFANYNEAMSYAKWLSVETFTTHPDYIVFVWNYNGGSGKWRNTLFTPLVNSNWP